MPTTTTREQLINRAISRLNSARDDLEAAMRLEADAGYRADIGDSVGDIGSVLVALETMAQWKVNVETGGENA